MIKYIQLILTVILGLNSYAQGDDKHLVWDTSNNTDYYIVYYSDTSTTLGTILGDTPDTSFVLVDADNGEKYYYRVKAVNASGKSDSSDYRAYQFFPKVGSNKKITLRAKTSKRVDIRTLFDKDFASINIWGLWVEYDSLYVDVSFTHVDSYEEAHLKITAQGYNVKETMITITGIGDDVMGEGWFHPGATSYIKIRITGGVDPPSDELLVDINDQQNNLPDAYNIKAYPNPFNSTIEVKLELPMAGQIKFDVVGITGKKVNVVHGYYQAGAHTFNLNKNMGLFRASGTYFLVLKTPEKRLIVKKISYIK